MNPLDLSGKLVLVTGASSGIGRATAGVLSRLGARVVLAGRREAALEETRAGLESPDLHLVAPFDLGDLDGVPGWMKGIVDRAGALLDGVVHSAGVVDVIPLRLLTSDNIARVMGPNLLAALALLRGAASRKVAADGASVVLLSSVAGSAGSPGLASYGSSKGGLFSLARTAAMELRSRRIRVNCVTPAYVATAMLDKARDTIAEFEAVEARQFLGIIEPDEVGTAVAYLLCDAARHITGTSLVIDAGYTC